MASNEKNRSFFKEYEEFRKFLKVNFYFSSLSSEGLTNYIDNIKATKYNSYKKIIEDISSGKIKFTKYNGKKSIKYDVNQFESDYNVLADSFRLKTLTALETIISIYTLLFLSDGGKTQNEIIEFFSDLGLDTNSVLNKVRNMHKYGLLYKNGMKYYLNNNLFEDLDDSELLRITNYADFMKAVIYPEALGYGMFNILKNIYEKKTGLIYNSPFQFKYSHLANILDNDVMWDLIEAISNRQYISFAYKSSKFENIIPVKIFTENEYNRTYLFAVIKNKKGVKFRVYKLTNIYNLNVSNDMVISDEEMLEFYSCYDNAKKYGYNGKIDTGKDIVEVKIKFNGKMKHQIKQRFEAVEFSGKNEAIVTLRNKKLIIPWLKANIGQVKALDDELSAIIDNEVMEMKKIYGIIS